MKGGPKDIVVSQIFNDAIFNFLVRCFRFKRSEHLVPSDKNTGIVAVEIARIGGMMHAVMRRRIHDRLKPARHAVNRFGMNPILVDEIETCEKEDECGWKAQEKQRHPEKEAEREKPGPGLPQSGR